MARSKPDVDKRIGEIVQRHMGLDPAIRMFDALCRIGGGKFQAAMRRVKRIAQERQAAR
ncbi:MAG TPA: hypothetical protein VFQ43_02810 [Nitrososphaera sp.]|nr:hypothetical protein [Nitrososphaera sp.]